MRGLGQLEAAVMSCVWLADEPLTVREVLVDLERERALAYTTVMTVMDNLHSKGFLTRERVGRAYAYRAARPREAYEAELIEDVLASSRDRTATLMHFVKTISATELAELRSLIAHVDGERS